MREADIAFDTDVPIPPEGRAGRALTPFSRAIQRLADDKTPIGSSFLWQGDKINSSATSKYGLGWTRMRKVDENGVRGTRIWKIAKAPGKGKRVEGTKPPVTRKKKTDAAKPPSR